jgi:hypothetical protein
MGLSIHYNGTFSKTASLSAMIEEVKDIAEVYKWQYIVFETEFPEGRLDSETYNDKVYGLFFAPPGCEPVYLTFLSNGRMSSDLNLKFWANEKGERAAYLYMLSTKTQYAGLQTHVTIIQLLRHVSKKYFSRFELMDEGRYWETNDLSVITESFDRYNYIINAVAEVLENNRLKQGENFEDFFYRVLKDIEIKKIKTDD